jgi:microsomal dipeptidase-like Zn-dependent dipeptidase
LYEVRRSARNLPADQAREIFRRGGLVGVTCWRHLLGREAGPLRAAWTRAYCATVHALADLDPLGKSRVAVGSDRGAPIRAPAWIFSPAHHAEIEARLARLGWTGEAIRGFQAANVRDFLARSLPAA